MTCVCFEICLVFVKNFSTKNVLPIKQRQESCTDYCGISELVDGSLGRSFYDFLNSGEKTGIIGKSQRRPGCSKAHTATRVTMCRAHNSNFTTSSGTTGIK